MTIMRKHPDGDDFIPFESQEEAVASLPLACKQIAKEFPPGSHFHFEILGVVWLWGYSEDGTQLVLSTVRPTPESIHLPSRDHVFGIPAEMFRSSGTVPCGHMMSSYGPAGTDKDVLDWAIPE